MDKRKREKLTYDSFMRDIGFIPGISGELYFCNLSERVMLFHALSRDGYWEFWKESYYKSGTLYKIYGTSKSFYQIYDQIINFRIWLSRRKCN